jgi:hypothetical protein
MGFETGCHLAHYRLGNKVKLLNSIVHAPRQRPAIERDDWVVRASGIGNQGRHGVGAFLENRFRQSSHGYTADSGGGHGATRNTCEFEKLTARIHKVNFRSKNILGFNVLHR